MLAVLIYGKNISVRHYIETLIISYHHTMFWQIPTMRSALLMRFQMKSVLNRPVVSNKCRVAVTLWHLCLVFLAVFNYIAGSVNISVRQSSYVQIMRYE